MRLCSARLHLFATFRRRFTVINTAASLQFPFICIGVEQRERKRLRAYFLAPAVLPRHPLDSVSGVAQAVAACKLLAVAVGVATLSPHQSQEVEFAQVHLLEAKGNAPLIKGAGRLTLKRVC